MTYQNQSITNRRRFYIFSKYGYICQKCFKYSKGMLHLHHIIPVKCGGSDYSDNIIPLCKDCHRYVHSRSYRGPLLKLRRRI